MVVMRSPNKPKTALVALLQKHYPAISFLAGNAFAWSPADASIMYDLSNKNNGAFAFSLLHEVGHALLGHSVFKNDVVLIKLERDAWDKAVEISGSHGIKIPPEHIEQCLDTYRDWLYARSLCPNCHQCGLQTSKTSYRCVFCPHEWKVSESRLCKVTRRSIKKNP